MKHRYKLPEEWFSLSVPTRYPDELQKLLKDFKRDLTRKTLKQTKELLEWLKKKII